MSDATRGRSLGRDAWLRFRKNRLAMAGAIFVTLVAVFGFSAPLISAHITHFSLDEQHNEFRLKPPGTMDVSKDHPTYDGDKSHFDLLDLNGDGVIAGAGELQDLRWTDRFLMFLMGDYDLVSEGEELTEQLIHNKPSGAHPDDQLSHEEFPDGFAQLDAKFKLEFVGFVRARLPAETQGDEAAVLAAAKERFDALQLGEEALFDVLDSNEDGFVTLNEVNDRRRRYRVFESPVSALEEMDENGDAVITRAEYPGAPELYTFWLGTDTLGRCVLTRILYGARISITIALAATLVSFLIGVTWGSMAGYYGGRLDSVMMRIVDVLYGLPFMFIVILLIVVFGRSTINLFIALGAVQWLTMSRVVRGQMISLKNREFVEAAVAIGVPRHRIVFRHLLRNTIGPVIVYSTLMVPAIILEEAFLSFLGLGVQPPNPSWGNMITDGANVMDDYAWLIIYPGLALGLTLFSMNFVGDGIRDALDPQAHKS